MIIALLAGLGYFVCARIGYALALRQGGVVAVWPPAGYLLGLLLLLPAGCWAPVVIGAMAGNAFADFTRGAAPMLAAIAAVANASESLLAAAVVRRFAGRDITLGTRRQAAVFLLGGVIASNAITSLIGAVVLRLSTHDTFWSAWFVWWTGDGMGMLLFAPVILTWAHVVRERARFSVPVVIEAALAMLAIGVVAHATISRVRGVTGTLDPDPYLVFPLLLWAAARFGPWGATTATVVLAGVTAWIASHGIGLFGDTSIPALTQVQSMYSYLALASTSSLIPASILSERRAAELQLRDSEQRFRQMAEHIKEAFFILDVDTGVASYASPTWSEIWGMPLERAQDPAAWLRPVQPEDRESIMDAQEVVRRGRAAAATFRIRRDDGSVRWVRARVFPVHDATGRVYRAVGAAEDITLLRQVEERYAQAQKMEAVGQLAGGVAHDFNNMLTVVLGHIELLLEQAPADDPRREDFEAIRRAANSASQLTRQLLIFSRQEVRQPRVLSVNDLVDGVTRMLTRLLGEHVTLELALDPEAGCIRADPQGIEQAIVNLAVNSRDAMPDGGRLLVETRAVTITEPVADGGVERKPGRYVMIGVSDTGIGMAPETRARAFEPFFTTKPVGKGTGLGLATVYGIVGQSEGFVSLYSEPGLGTTVKLYFPQVDVAPAAGPAR
ncbi:MAG TPA: MASE1 domain-containing protein, partial [Gemmatimonadaceae bacterium]|nr:MASE1 domain-containing protein [Gemmatimonadaceae bacterium]